MEEPTTKKPIIFYVDPHTKIIIHLDSGQVVKMKEKRGKITKIEGRLVKITKEHYVVEFDHGTFKEKVWLKKGYEGKLLRYAR